MSTKLPVTEPTRVPNSPEPTPNRTAGAPAAHDPAGRGADGKFAKGNKGGPGNPFNRQVAALRKALLDRVTAEDIEEVLAVLLIKAKSGDLAAIKLLLSYTIGKPGPAVDPDTLDQQEWQIHQQAAVPPQQVHELMDALPAATANAMAQIAWPCAAQQQMRPIVAGLRAAGSAAANPASAAPAAEPTDARAQRSDPPPSSERIRPPSPNSGIGDQHPARATEPCPGVSSGPATPRPQGPPEHIDWEYEQRIMDILFGEDDTPPDRKRPNSESDREP